MLVFPAAAAGTGFVAAYFGRFATVGRLCILCIIVHGWRIFAAGGRGGSGALCIIVHGRHNLLVDLCYIDRDLLSWGRGRAGNADDEQGGF